MRKFLTIGLIIVLSLGIFVAAALNEEDFNEKSVEFRFSTDDAVQVSEKFVHLFYEFTNTIKDQEVPIEDSQLISLLVEGSISEMEELANEISKESEDFRIDYQISVETIDIVKDTFVVTGEIIESIQQGEDELLQVKSIVISLVNIDDQLLVNSFEFIEVKG